MKRMSCFVVACVTWLLPIGALAWDGAIQGRISKVEVAEATNYALRVHVVGDPPMCGAQTPDWAYLNEADSNYRVYVAVILAAKQAGDTVMIYTNRDSSGYCKVGYLASWAS